MSKPKPEFSLEELLAQLRIEEDEEGKTIRELCEEMGILPVSANRAGVRRKIDDLMVLGNWECTGKKRVEGATGSKHWAPCYKPK